MVDGFVVFLRRQQYYFTLFITSITYTTTGGHIFNAILSFIQPTDKELHCLTDYRKNLQVITLVDITSVDGKKIML